MLEGHNVDPGTAYSGAREERLQKTGAFVFIWGYCPFPWVEIWVVLNSMFQQYVHLQK